MSLGTRLLLSIGDSRKDGCGSMDILAQACPTMPCILLALYALSSSNCQEGAKVDS